MLSCRCTIFGATNLSENGIRVDRLLSVETTVVLLCRPSSFWSTERICEKGRQATYQKELHILRKSLGAIRAPTGDH